MLMSYLDSFPPLLVIRPRLCQQKQLYYAFQKYFVTQFFNYNCIDDVFYDLFVWHTNGVYYFCNRFIIQYRFSKLTASVTHARLRVIYLLTIRQLNEYNAENGWVLNRILFV